MVINLDADVEAALLVEARRVGLAPDALAVKVLTDRFLHAPPLKPADQWERNLFGAALDCGVSVADSALSSDGLYE